MKECANGIVSCLGVMALEARKLLQPAGQDRRES